LYHQEMQLKMQDNLMIHQHLMYRKEVQ